MTSLQQLTPGSVFAGDFVVERRLASGGMGAVYVVTQRSTGHRRALKVMHPEIVLDPRNRERFAQEARVGALIQSPYVVEVAAAGVDEASGTPWLLMELLDGESLHDRILRGDLPDRATLREMFAQLGDALGRAHAAGVVHRDLKPENLFIATSRLRGVPFLVKVLDFGIAAIVSEQKRSATVTTVIGSPMWMAPEQANVGAQVGAPADVWALGLITFYALTGRHFWPSLTGPSDAINIAALLVDIVVNPIPTPSARAAVLGVAERVPAGFDAWFARCVARDPAQRFPEARAAIDALLPLLTEGTVSDPAFSETLMAPASPARTPPPVAPPPVAPPPVAVSLPATSQLLEVPSPPSPRKATARRRGWPLVLAVTALTAATVVAAVALRSKQGPPPTIAATRPTPPPRARPDAAAPPDVVVPAVDAPRATEVAVDDVAPAEAAAVAREGQLVVTCTRHCRVTIDGEDRGSPRRPFALAAGSHVVVASRGDRSLTQTAQVVAGETARVAFVFDDAPDAAAPTVRPTAPTPGPTAPSPTLPDRPDRAAVEAAFHDVNAGARGCGARGRVFVGADFASDGRVTAAQVEGPLANTPTGECIVRAVRRARLPPFRRPSIRVSQALDL